MASCASCASCARPSVGSTSASSRPAAAADVTQSRRRRRRCRRSSRSRRRSNRGRRRLSGRPQMKRRHAAGAAQLQPTKQRSVGSAVKKRERCSRSGCRSGGWCGRCGPQPSRSGAAADVVQSQWAQKRGSRSSAAAAAAQQSELSSRSSAVGAQQSEPSSHKPSSRRSQWRSIRGRAVAFVRAAQTRSRSCSCISVFQ